MSRYFFNTCILVMVGPSMIFYNGPMTDITFLSINSSLPMICCENDVDLEFIYLIYKKLRSQQL